MVHFQRVRLFFQNFFLVSISLIIPCSNFIFFQKIVGEGGGVKKNFQDLRIFSGHKKGVKKNFRTNISLAKTHFP